MENVSSSNGLEKCPKLRFPGFMEPYNQYRIGEIYAERSQRGAADMELLSVTLNDGVKPRSEIEGKDNSSEDKSNYKIVRAGDMVYNSMRMWQGANGISPCDGIVSPAYTVLMPKEIISNSYLAALFKCPNLINELRKNSQGMTSDTWNLKYPQIEAIKIYLPSLVEQEHIADMLGILEFRIAKQTQLVESLKKYKRGLLSYYFSLTHMIHLGNAESYTFADIACRRTEKYNPRSGKDSLCIELEHIEQETGRILGSTSTTNPNSIKNVCRKNDVLFGKLRPYLRKYALVKQECVCSSEIWVLVPKKTVIPQFLFYLVQSDEFIKVANISSGTKMPRAEWSNVEKAVFYIPPADVQQEIISQLEGIDVLIGGNDKIRTQLDNLKRGLLQQLFI